MNLRIVLAVSLIPLILPVTSLHAQETLSPDRPGLGNGSYVLNPKITYLESGFEYLDTGSLDQFSMGQVLFRHGLTDGLELRVLLNSLIIQTSPVDNQSGFPDPGVGLKVNIIDWPVSSFRLSGLGSVSIPAGSSSFTNHEWVSSFSLLADIGVSEYWGLSGNLGYTFGRGLPDDIWMFTLTPAYLIPDSNLGIYFGYAGFYSEPDHQYFLEAGITKFIQADLQLDVNGGVDAGSGNMFIGAGLVIKF